MKRQLVIIGIVAILITVGLSGCTNNNNGSSNTNDNTGKNGGIGTFNEKILGA